MTDDTKHFLEALSFASPEDSDIRDVTIFKYHPNIVHAVDRFCDAFRGYCTDIGLDLDLSDQRGFGANVYFTLSGHGCGFQDDNGPWGDVFAEVLRRFAGTTRYRFEGLDGELWRGPRRMNLVHFSVKREFLIERLDAYFGFPDSSTLPDISEYVAIAYCPVHGDLRAVPAEGFVAPPYWTGKAWTLEPFTVARYTELVGQLTL